MIEDKDAPTFDPRPVAVKQREKSLVGKPRKGEDLLGGSLEDVKALVWSERSKTMTKRQKNVLREAAIQIGAGGSAGFVEVCIMHPMDLIKTRLQLQVKSSRQEAAYYTGIRDCMRKMHRVEGLPAFWKGIVPPILVETPKRAVKFFTFEQYKGLFMFGGTQATPLTFSCAGFFAGMTEAILVNPFEVIKVQLQSDRRHVRESPSTVFVTKRLLAQEGLWALNKGLTATIMRNAVFNAFYFGIYHSVLSKVPREGLRERSEFLLKVVVGFISGTVASCLNIPFDVAKSRIQGPQDGTKYKGTARTICLVYRTEGFRALYKGLLPKVLRLGPGGAIMLVVYDYASSYLRRRFDD